MEDYYNWFPIQTLASYHREIGGKNRLLINNNFRIFLLHSEFCIVEEQRMEEDTESKPEDPGGEDGEEGKRASWKERLLRLTARELRNLEAWAALLRLHRAPTLVAAMDYCTQFLRQIFQVVLLPYF